MTPSEASDGPAHEFGFEAEARLSQLAAAGRPVRRALATIAARLLDTRAYEPLCFARLGDYARERTGLSARQLRDLAHVHRALMALPPLESAFAEGALPWSKVRLVARVATLADVQTWTARARALPIRQLELEVSTRVPVGHSVLEGADDPDLPLMRVTVHCTPAVREKWALAHDMAERVAGQRLRAGEALEWVTAEACSGSSIGAWLADAPETPRARARDLDSDRAADDEVTRDANARVLPTPASSLIAPLLDALEYADAFELDRRLRAAVRLEQTLDAAIAPLLRLVTSSEYEWRGPCLTLAACAAERLGISTSKARALLRIERAGDVCPELRLAFREGRLSWARAQCLLPLLLLDIGGPWRPCWVAWAERVTLRRLEADVERALLLRAGHDPAWQRCKHHPERAQDPIPEAEQQKCAPEIDIEATQQLSWRLPLDVAWLFSGARESFRAMLRAAGARPATDGEAFAALLDHALATWSLRDPGARRPDPVIERDGHLCAAPACSSRRSLHDHHIVFRSAQGSDAPENRITLCAFHHERCLHKGLLRLVGEAPDHLVFELGVRTGAAPLARYRSGDIAL